MSKAMLAPSSWSLAEDLGGTGSHCAHCPIGAPLGGDAGLPGCCRHRGASWHRRGMLSHAAGPRWWPAMQTVSDSARSGKLISMSRLAGRGPGWAARLQTARGVHWLPRNTADEPAPHQMMKGYRVQQLGGAADTACHKSRARHPTMCWSLGQVSGSRHGGWLPPGARSYLPVMPGSTGTGAALPPDTTGGAGTDVLGGERLVQVRVPLLCQLRVGQGQLWLPCACTAVRLGCTRLSRAGSSTRLASKSGMSLCAASCVRAKAPGAAAPHSRQLFVALSA